jgi:hypothetical protein
LGYHPRISFRDGGQVEKYDAQGRVVEGNSPGQNIVTGAAGPAVTLALAIVFAIFYLKRRDSYWLFAGAITNSVFRLNILVDGFNSDEGNISRLLTEMYGNQMAFLIPLTEWTLLLALGCFLIRIQDFTRKSYWFIPLYFVIDAVSFRTSFSLLGLILG